MIGRFDVLQASDIQIAGFGFEWLTRRWSIAIVFSLLSIAPVARIVRAQTLSLSEREFVLASRSLGARTPRILFREILPNLVPAMVSVLFTGIGDPARRPKVPSPSSATASRRPTPRGD